MSTYPKKRTLKNNKSVRIRPINASDKLTLYEAYEHLSEHSRFMRFFLPPKHLNDKLLKYLTEVDGYTHIALIACIQDKVVGVARCIRLLKDMHIAEMAVTVADDYQGQGLGRILVTELKELAKQKDIQILRAYIHPENHKLRNIFKKWNLQSKYAEGTLVLDLELNN